MTGRTRRFLMVLDLAILGACAAIARAMFRELFVDVPGVHVASWPGRWVVPNAAATVLLVAALFGGVAALALLIGLRWPSSPRVARTVELIALATMLCAWLTWIADFLGNAGRFG